MDNDQESNHGISQEQVQAEDYAAFPHPEKLDQSGELEQHLLTLNLSGLFEYKALPHRFNATGIEEYANWMANWAVDHPRYTEVLEYIRISRKERKLVFPKKAKVGILSVFGPFTTESENELPVAISHSHETWGTYSPGDIYVFLNGNETHFKGQVKIPAFTLSTPWNNFTLLRTNQTRVKDKEEIENQFSNVQKYFDPDEAKRYLADVDLLVDPSKLKNVPALKELSTEQIRKIRESLGFKYLGMPRNFHKLYKSYWAVLALSEQCKFGFYFSNKDGKYQQVTRDNLPDIISSSYNAAIQNVREELNI